MFDAAHSHAALTPRARLKLARVIIDDELPIPRAGERHDVSWRTAKKWAERYRLEGEAGMVDPSSQPHHQPNRTPARRVKKTVDLRIRLRLGPIEIADHLGTVASTVHAVLVRWRLNRLTHLDRITSNPFDATNANALGNCSTWTSRSSATSPTAAPSVSLDANKGGKNRAATSAGTGAAKSIDRQPLIGTCDLHTVIDDHSRVAYLEAHDDETTETAVEGPTQRSRPVHYPRCHCRTGPDRHRRLLPLPPAAT
nr:leucine zipper domain-containing protein [Schaalia hyovaginalis]